MGSCSTKFDVMEPPVVNKPRHGADCKQSSTTTVRHHRSAYYNLGHKPEGRCIVFNVQRFIGCEHQERTGGEVDASRITETFGNLGFKVEVFSNPTTRKVEEILEKESNEKHDDTGCFVCFFLSHGKLGYIYSSDGPMMLGQLIEPIARSEGLKKKPKLFFVQACQQFDGKDYNEAENGWSYSIPSYPDVCVGFSSPPGYYSWRTEREGSVYIATLCSVLDEEASSVSPRHLLSLIAVVHRRLAVQFETHRPGDPPTHQKKLIPCLVSSLTRKLVLMPGVRENLI